MPPDKTVLEKQLLLEIVGDLSGCFMNCPEISTAAAAAAGCGWAARSPIIGVGDAHLVVTTATGVQLLSCLPSDLGQSPLVRRVDVLVSRLKITARWGGDTDVLCYTHTDSVAASGVDLQSKDKQPHDDDIDSIKIF